jgi:hypothetical protein
MIGVQGVFAGVVPVFGGRSIRGTSASVIGMLILVWQGLGVMAALWMLFAPPNILFWVINVAAGAGMIAALIIYVWCLPTAARDFADDSV